MITSSKMVNPPFVRFGCADPRHPLLISVPHSGRDYPPGLALLSRLSVAQLRPLEDRFADLLIEDAVSAGHAALVARMPRAWVDLNRRRTGVRSRPGFRRRRVVPLAAKVRGGLGVVPRRVLRGGDIWRGRLSADAFEARLVGAHRPRHNESCRDARGDAQKISVAAVLLDVHSMPPLSSPSGGALHHRSLSVISSGDRPVVNIAAQQCWWRNGMAL
ncbi:MAG: N-formylglutamate amidohydrolase [Sphingomonadales bacterium]|nr:N-formylglutamate amidohydrolase [Sphingomonadales bacterium]